MQKVRKMFNRPEYVKVGSPVDAVMNKMEAAALSGNLAIVEKYYAYFLENMGGCGASERKEDDIIAEYVEQFDYLFEAA